MIWVVRRIQLEKLRFKLDDSKDDAAKTKRELEVEKEKRQWQADLSVH